MSLIPRTVEEWRALWYRATTRADAWDARWATLKAQYHDEPVLLADMARIEREITEEA